MARVISVARVKEKLSEEKPRGGVRVKLKREHTQFRDRLSGWTIKGGEVKTLPPDPISQRLLRALQEGALVFVEDEKDSAARKVVQPDEPENLSKTSVESTPPEKTTKKKTTTTKKKKTPAKKTTKKKPAGGAKK